MLLIPLRHRITQPCSDLIRRQDTADVRNENEPGRRSAAKLLSEDEAERQTARASVRAVWRFLNEAHVPFDFFCVLLCFFAMRYSFTLDAPLPVATVAHCK